MATETTQRVSPWRERNVWLLLGGQWISQMGNVCFTLAIFWYVLADTHSRTDLGLVGAAGALTGIFSILTGVLVDRWDRRRTLIWTDSARALLMTGVFVLLESVHAIPLIALIAIVAAVNLGGAVFSPAQFALLPELVDSENLSRVNGLDQSATSMSQWIGYAVAGWVIGLAGVAGLVGGDAVTFVVSAASLVGMKTSRQPAKMPGQGDRTATEFWRQVIAGQRVLWSHSFLRRALPTALVVNFSMMVVSVLDVAWAREVLHQGALVYGMLESAAVIGGIAGGLVAAWLLTRIALKALIAGSLVIAGGAMVGMAVDPTVATSLMVLGLVGMCFGVLNVTMASTIQRVVPREVLGRIGGSLMAVSGLSMPLGAVVAGLAGSLFPLPVVFIIAGILVMAMALPFVWVPTEFHGFEFSGSASDEPQSSGGPAENR